MESDKKEIAKVGELFIKSWNFFKENWQILFVIMIVPTVFSKIGSILSYSGRGSNNVALLLLGVIITFVSIVFSIVVQATMVRFIHDKQNHLHKPKFDLVHEYRRGFKYFWPMLWVIMIEIVVVLGASALFILPGIIVSVYICMYLFPLVIDDKRGVSAIVDSYSLVGDNFLSLFSRLIFIFIFNFLLSIIFGVLSAIINIILGFKYGTVPSLIINSLFDLICSGLVGSFALVYLYNLYLSLKSTSVHANTDTFRKWLTVFAVIALIVAILFIYISVVYLLNS